MSETPDSIEQGSVVNPAENLDRWLSDYDKTENLRDDAVEAAEPEASEPAVPAQEPEAPKTGAWREVVLDDVDHGFFKGKKAADLYESYRHAETAMQRAQREAAELRQQLAQVQQPQVRQEPVQNATDPRDAEINRLWFENPAEARRLMEERFIERQEQVTQRVLTQREQAYAAESFKANSVQASGQVLEYVKQSYGVDGDRAAKMLMSSFPHLKFQEGADPYVWARPEKYVEIIRDLYGEPAPREAATQVAAPAPVVIPDPPGNRRPSPAAAPANSRANALSSEEMAARRELATIAANIGVKVSDKFLTESRNGGRTRG